MPVAPGPQHRDPGRSRGAQPAAARRRAITRAQHADRASRAPERADAPEPSAEDDEAEPAPRRDAGRDRKRGAAAAFIVLTGCRLGQVAGDPRARGPRLLLRRQPADHARSRRWRSCRCAPAARSPKVAIVVDVREGGFLASFPKMFRQLRKMPRLNPVLIFLEASHAALVRRFSETRRPHPLAPDRSVSEGIRDERAAAERHPRHGRRDRRHLGHDGPRAAAVLHGAVARPQRDARAGRHAPELRLQARRAGRRRPGVRRALPAEPAFRAGAAPPDRARPRGRRDSCERDRSTREFIDRLEDLLRFVVPYYIARGKELPDDRHRLHRRPPPLGDDRRAPRARRWPDADGVAACASGIGTWSNRHDARDGPSSPDAAPRPITLPSASWSSRTAARDELVNAAEMIVGDLPQFTAVSIGWHDDVERRARRRSRRRSSGSRRRGRRAAADRHVRRHAVEPRR